MTPLLSLPFAIVLTAIAGVLLVALIAATVLLVLLALLTLDVLLDRNGIDRRAGIRRGWDRLRRPTPAPERTTATPPATQAPDAEPRSAAAPRVPFSARRGARPAKGVPPEVAEPHTSHAVPEEPAPTPSELTGPTAIARAGAPTPVADAVTEVLDVDLPPARPARPARTPRVTPRRTPSPDPAPEPAPSSDPAPVEPPPADRDSAIDRLFAPLLESDRTEPLPRAPRGSRDEG